MPQSVWRCRACAERETSAGRSTTIFDSPCVESEVADGWVDDAEAAEDGDADEGEDGADDDDEDADEEAAESLAAKWRAIASSMASAFALWCSHDGALGVSGVGRHT
jgi:hypothetical protein